MRPPRQDDPLAAPARGQGHGGIVVPTEQGVISTHEWRLDQQQKVRQPRPPAVATGTGVASLGLQKPETVHGGRHSVKMTSTGPAVVIAAGSQQSLATATYPISFTYLNQLDTGAATFTAVPWAVAEPTIRALRILESGLYRVTFVFNLTANAGTTGALRVVMESPALDVSGFGNPEFVYPATLPVTERWTASAVIRSGYERYGLGIIHQRAQLPTFYNRTNGSITIAAGFYQVVEQLGYWDLAPPEFTPSCGS